MKKLLSAALCGAMLFTAAPVKAAELYETVIPEKGESGIYTSVYCGDTNFDSVIDAVDLMNLRTLLFGEDLSDGTFPVTLKNAAKLNADVNFDGIVNIIDMIEMKRAIIGETDLYEKKSAVEISDKPVENCSETGKILNTTSELREYLKIITDDPDRVEEYLSEYSDEFFENNSLAVGVMYQKRGEGVMYAAMPAFYINQSRGDEHTECIVVFGDYTCSHCPLLYPVTDTYLFVQESIPKKSYDGLTGEIVDISDWFTPDSSGYYYSSKDGENEIFIVQQSFLLMGSIDVYRDNHDGTFTYLHYLSGDDGMMPFDDKGEWKKDEDGNDIFTNDTSYSFRWYDDHAEIKYYSDSWLTDTVYFRKH